MSQAETREFPTTVIASISTGVLMCEFSKMHEAAEFLMGHPIWTHHFADKDLWRKMQATIAEQCPGMPVGESGITADNWAQKALEIATDIGETVTIRRGAGLTAQLPTDGIPDHIQTIVI